VEFYNNVHPCIEFWDDDISDSGNIRLCGLDKRLRVYRYELNSETFKHYGSEFAEEYIYREGEMLGPRAKNEG
jgi:hypothetical protein